MRIRILTSRGGHPCGAIVDVSDDQARAWIGVGDAEALAPAPIETAVAESPETAMREPAKARGRR